MCGPAIGYTALGPAMTPAAQAPITLHAAHFPNPKCTFDRFDDFYQEQSDFDRFDWVLIGMQSGGQQQRCTGWTQMSAPSCPVSTSGVDSEFEI